MGLQYIVLEKNSHFWLLKVEELTPFKFCFETQENGNLHLHFNLNGIRSGITLGDKLKRP